MTHWRFDALLQNNTWLTPAYVSLDNAGRLLRLDETPQRGVDYDTVSGWAIHGFQNAHSHAFQLAMAGLSEHLPREHAQDNFWRWRQVMYQLALQVTPEDVESIATFLYADMLKQGFTAVAEFHYLHHDPQGQPYDDPTTMAAVLCRAAQRAGIRLTLIPVYYQQGDFHASAKPEQRRFVFKDVDAYLQLLAAYTTCAKEYDFDVGAGLHSLRAANPHDIKALFSQCPQTLPFHVHVAEQQKEVAGCLAALGQRPVQWLLDNLALDGRCHLVHATHIDEVEMAGILQTQAQVVLCPSTEANLGDGIFPLKDFHAQGGRWSLGTDSHVGRSPLEELRWLDYTQRLTHEMRNPLCQPGEDSGEQLYSTALIGGQAAMGRRGEGFQEGTLFEALVLDPQHPLFTQLPPQHRLATLIFAADASAIQGTLVGGRWVAKQGHHHEESQINQSFKTTLARLRLKSK